MTGCPTFLLVPGGGSDPSYWRFLVTELPSVDTGGLRLIFPVRTIGRLHYADAVAVSFAATATGERWSLLRRFHRSACLHAGRWAALITSRR